MVNIFSMEECTSKNQLYPKISRFKQCSIKGTLAKRHLGVESKLVCDHLESFKPRLIMLDAPTHFEDNSMHASEGIAMEDRTLIQKKRSNNLRGKGKINKTQRKVDNIKGQWSNAEDIILTDLVKQHGARGWSQIAEMLPGRVGKQCRERWQNHLRPDIKKGGWSEEEDKLLISIHKEVGNKWSEIAKRLPWRSENTIKNHFNATKRRQPLPKNNNRSSSSRNSKRNSSLLQNYIRTTLSLSSSSTSSSSNSKDVVSFETTDGATVLIYKPEGKSSLESKHDQQTNHVLHQDSNSSLESLDYLPIVRHTSHIEYGVNSILDDERKNWVFDDHHYYDHQMPYDLSMALMELEIKRENDFMATAFQDFLIPF